MKPGGQVNGIEMVPKNQSEGVSATAPNRLGNTIRALPNMVTPRHVSFSLILSLSLFLSLALSLSLPRAL